ncbi:MAG: plastocyanin/azurin family copper-binding protein [Thermoproteota archaeon]|nr:plastocyanin/azurin family copper-binding protein [Thermoproteota archaeon]
MTLSNISRRFSCVVPFLLWQSFTYTFDKEGEYPYFCDIHPGMVGTVLVTERSP